MPKKRKGKSRAKEKKKKKGVGVYLEYKDVFGSSSKFWEISKQGSICTTKYGKIGSLGSVTTKDYGDKVDDQYDKMIKAKKKKGYVEGWFSGDINPKPPTSAEREYLKACKAAENSAKLNDSRKNFDCEGLTYRPGQEPISEEELKWNTKFYKDAKKRGEFDWTLHDEYYADKRRKKRKTKSTQRRRTQRRGGKWVKRSKKITEG